MLMTQPVDMSPGDEASFTLALITSRQNILPKRLAEPGPSDRQVADMFKCAAAAPDHGEVMPWRFVLVPLGKRAMLADVFGNALLERVVSVGAAIQNFLLSAHSMGFGSSLTSGQAMRSAALRQLFALADGEQAVCCINVGTVIKRKPARLRPDLAVFVSSL
jgi:nitroreductase